MWIIITILTAVVGGFVLKRLKVPAGLLLGAVLAVGVLNVLSGKAYIWPQTRVFSQIVAGVYLGGMMTIKDIRHLPKIIKPYLLIMVSFLVLNITVGFILYCLTDLSLITCLLSAMPGGISDAPLVAMDMGAQVSAVMVLQFIRVIFGLACLPPLIVLADKFIEPEAVQQVSAHTNSKKKKNIVKAPFIPYIPTFAVGAAAGLLGYFSGVAAGALSCSMVAVAALSVTGKAKPMPEWLRIVAQLLCGCCIGVTVQLEQIQQIPDLIIPAVICCTGYLVVCIGMGLVVSRLFGFQVKEA
ncbi:MAG: AbrB family transcriptional regulator, partial [Bacteroidaceae bacterium]|nr:AbrB family transcriptional regulator [Bacteroidaceae bacterium]